MYIAIIAVFHVVASHLTVGAAWFNLYVERRAVREHRSELYAYLQRSAKGLLVFAYVFGAMAGVGIWQSTTASNPRGISTLIHNFVLFWGSEWYMFMIDVLGIVTYYYTIGKVQPKTHLRLAWILALGGTGTLSLIVGILGFKLSPGKWLESGEPLEGFFNPTFWPQFFLRLMLMLTITGLWAILIAAGMPREFPERSHVLRWAGTIGLGGLSAALLLGQFWYVPNIPERSKGLLSTVAFPAATPYLIGGGLAVTAVALLYAMLKPHLQTRFGAVAIFVVAFVAIFGAERTREILRKPDVISGYMSSNGLVYTGLSARGVPSEEARLNETGILGNLPFVPALEEITPTEDYPDREIAAGRTLAIQQCGSCHSVSDQTVVRLGDHQLALRQQSQRLVALNATKVADIETFLSGLGNYPFMHAFVGSDEEKRLLAKYLEHMVRTQQRPADDAPAENASDTPAMSGE